MSLLSPRAGESKVGLGGDGGFGRLPGGGEGQTGLSTTSLCHVQGSQAAGIPRSCLGRPTRGCARWPASGPGTLPVWAAPSLGLGRRVITTAQSSTRRYICSPSGGGSCDQVPPGGVHDPDTTSPPKGSEMPLPPGTWVCAHTAGPRGHLLLPMCPALLADLLHWPGAAHEGWEGGQEQCVHQLRCDREVHHAAGEGRQRFGRGAW